jgi:nanoRNase/pAp phosphatase (c-di-AMP/oligoRNAs hydrolase)
MAKRDTPRPGIATGLRAKAPFTAHMQRIVMSQQKYRLLTRSDFDGLVCAILLKELGILGSIEFVHPKDVQDGRIKVSDRDILTNLPYAPGCHLCFDHHASEAVRNQGAAVNHILHADAQSAARVVYEYFGGFSRFRDIDTTMMQAVDKADSASFTADEILNPSGWTMLSFVMDPRTGLGRFRDFRLSNYELLMRLIDDCRELCVDEVLALPDVRERVELYQSHRGRFSAQLRRCASVHGNVVVLDLRSEKTIYAGNRFMIYVLFPECNVSIHAIWGVKQQNTVFAIGKSIINRTNRADIGGLALKYGGGGHEAAGTCQIPNQDADQVLPELINQLRDESLAIELVTAETCTR